jgi:hypothetical protein
VALSVEGRAPQEKVRPLLETGGGEGWKEAGEGGNGCVFWVLGSGTTSVKLPSFFFSKRSGFLPETRKLGMELAGEERPLSLAGPPDSVGAEEGERTGHCFGLTLWTGVLSMVMRYSLSLSSFPG